VPKRTILSWCALLLLWAAAQQARGLPIVELEALGLHADPHNITVAPGTPVRLVYTLSYADNLSLFQNNLTVIGDPATIATIDATDAATWWGEPSTNTLSFSPQPATDMHILLGETSMDDPPYSYSDPDEVILAFIDLTAFADTVVDLLSLADPDAVNMWLWCEPDDPATGGELLIDLANSRPLVTIHVAHDSVIPEPATVLLLALGLGATRLRRRRR